jgi:hypothetical protein
MVHFRLGGVLLKPEVCGAAIGGDLHFCIPIPDRKSLSKWFKGKKKAGPLVRTCFFR